MKELRPEKVGRKIHAVIFVLVRGILEETFAGVLKFEVIPPEVYIAPEKVASQ